MKAQNLSMLLGGITLGFAIAGGIYIMKTQQQPKSV